MSVIMGAMAKQVKKNLGVTHRKSGMEFRVWAPFAKNIQISGTFTPEKPLDMASEGDGYWSIHIKDAEVGQQYCYLIDTGNEILRRNDPRARAITASDNGFSVVVDSEFDWGDTEFTPPPKNQQVIYELHIGTFNRADPATPGTFDTAIEKLDYLQSLGVNMIELMPITSMAYSHGWGYAPNYLYSVESMYGGRHGLMKFVRECHARGIGVILDVVYNHFSSETDLWQFDGWSENGRGGIYFYNDERGDTPWGGRPDYGRPEVRQFILDNVTMWMTEYRLDGLRIDSTIYMRNTEGRDGDPEHDIPDAWNLLGDITKLAHKINPAAIIIAEDNSVSAAITKPTTEGGCGFDAQWELGVPHVLRDALALTPDFTPNISGVQFELLRSYNGDAFEKVIFSDSHDTAANGSVRLNEAAAPENASSLRAQQKLLAANTLALTAPGIPMLLQGSEFLQEGAFNDWKVLEWDKTHLHTGIVLAHQHLIALRKNTYGNTSGLLGQSTAVFHQDNENLVIGYHRWDRGGIKDDVLVIINFSEHAFENYHLQLPRKGIWYTRFNSTWQGYNNDFREAKQGLITTDADARATIRLSPYMACMLSQE